MTSRLKVSIHDINPSMISVIFDDVRTNSNRASLPAVNTPIDFFLPPSIRPMDFLQETSLPRVWRRWYLWPSCERDQSSTGTTVDALVDHLPQDSSPAGSSTACQAAYEAAPTPGSSPTSPTFDWERQRSRAPKSCHAFLAFQGCFPHCSCVFSVIS